MKKRYLFVIVLTTTLLFNACQQSILDETEDVDTTASTAWGADIGSKVWLDRNYNGLKELYEPGIADITVNLWTDTNSDGLADEKIMSMQTDAKGQYRFNALNPEINYMIEVILPKGFIFSEKRVTGVNYSDFDSDVNSNGFTDSLDVRKGNYLYRIDAALFQGDAAPTYPTGNTRIGSRVWLDQNADGLKQATEPGLANVTLKLWWDPIDGRPDRIVKTTQSDKNGFYKFEGLDGFAYFYIEVLLPNGYAFSPFRSQAAQSNYWDSDILPATGFSERLGLEVNTLNYTYNAGLIKLPAPNLEFIQTTRYRYGETWPFLTITNLYPLNEDEFLATGYSSSQNHSEQELIGGTASGFLGTALRSEIYGQIDLSEDTIRTDLQGNIYYLSRTKVNSGYTLSLTKLQNTQRWSWNKSIPTNNLVIRNFEVNSKSESILIGTTHTAIDTSSDKTTALTLKTLDSNGNELNTRNYPEFKSLGLVADTAIDKQDNIYILSSQQLIKIDKNLNLVWSKLLTSISGEAPKLAISEAEGIYIVGNQKTDSITNNEISMLKLDSNGNELLSTTYIAPNKNIDPVALAINASNQIYIAGNLINPNKLESQDNSDILILKYSSTGEQIYDHIYNSGKTDTLTSFITLPNGNLVMSHQTQDSDVYTSILR